MSDVKPQKPKFRSLAVVALVVSTALAGLLGGYAIADSLQIATLPLQVEDPIKIISYPTSMSLFPGESAQVNVTVQNQASVTYAVTLKYQLNDSAYQANFVTFNHAVFSLAPGTQTLTDWLTVAPQAPAANFLLTVTCSRNITSNPSPVPPPTTQPTTTANATSDNSTLPPSLQLLQAGAAWASPNGTNALYIDWKDCWLNHAKTDGTNWGPWWSIDTMDSWRSEVVQVLTNDGFNVTCAGDFPTALTGYNLVVIEAFYSIEPKNAGLIKDFVADGGGIVMIGATPCFFSAYCKDFWPCNVDGTNLTSIQDWFGYSSYTNYFGDAYPVTNNPLGTTLQKETEIFWCSSTSASPATVYGTQPQTQVIAQYVPDTRYGFQFGIPGTGLNMPPIHSPPAPFPGENFPTSNPPFAFTHEYGAGRVYWQGHIWPF